MQVVLRCPGLDGTCTADFWREAMGGRVRSARLGWLALSLMAAAVPMPAEALPFSTTESQNYLIIACKESKDMKW